jgi:hypothetical protein
MLWVNNLICQFFCNYRGCSETDDLLYLLVITTTYQYHSKAISIFISGIYNMDGYIPTVVYIYIYI